MADSDHNTTSGKSPAFQFYPKDFLSDEEQTAMSLAEAGMYIRLLCACWNNGSLPNDAARIAKLCGATMAEVRKHWPVVRAKFLPCPDDPSRLCNARLEREREKQADYRRRQSDKGRASGASRRNHGSTAVQPQFNHGSTGVQAETGKQPEPKPNSSSAISNLQSSSPVSGQQIVRSRRSAGLMEGSQPSRHGDCLAHGPVCFRPNMAAKYLPRFGSDRARMLAWANAVCEDWSNRVERGEVVPEGDDYAYWAARYDEHHKHTAQPAASARTIALAKSDIAFLREN